MAWEFLQEAAKLNPTTMKPVRIIMGNESCDLDSAVSTIAYTYLQNCLAQSNPDIGMAIPLMNIKREDFPLKTEVLYFLRKFGVPLQDLFFRDTIDLEVLRLLGTLEIILVDNHTLAEADLPLKSNVIEVVDHRPLDPEWPWEHVKKTIESVASCATLVAETAIKQGVYSIPQEIISLLHGTILLDTACLSDDPKKYTVKDMNMIQHLEDLLAEKPDRNAIYKELLSARNDITNLTVAQVLRKDMKMVQNVPIATVPLLIKAFLGLTGAEAEIHNFASSSQHKAAIILGVSCEEDNYQRELAIYAEDPSLLLMITSSLKSNRNPDFELEDVRGISNMPKMNIFHQGNRQASRKQVLPVVKQAVSNWLLSHGSNN